jgi:hypothetical protein
MVHSLVKRQDHDIQLERSENNNNNNKYTSTYTEKTNFLKMRTKLLTLAARTREGQESGREHERERETDQRRETQ